MRRLRVEAEEGRRGGDADTASQSDLPNGLAGKWRPAAAAAAHATKWGADATQVLTAVSKCGDVSLKHSAHSRRKQQVRNTFRPRGIDRLTNTHFRESHCDKSLMLFPEEYWFTFLSS